MKINSKDDIIEYFKNGYKKKFSIGVENEKFLFDINSKSRANYKQVKDVLNFLKKFGWKEISEDNNLIGLNNNKQSITLEPGNQIELSGGLCENVHQVCAESFKFQKQLDPPKVGRGAGRYASRRGCENGNSGCGSGNKLVRPAVDVGRSASGGSERRWRRGGRASWPLQRVGAAKQRRPLHRTRCGEAAHRQQRRRVGTRVLRWSAV